MIASCVPTNSFVIFSIQGTSGVSPDQSLRAELGYAHASMALVFALKIAIMQKDMRNQMKTKLQISRSTALEQGKIASVLPKGTGATTIVTAVARKKMRVRLQQPLPQPMVSNSSPILPHEHISCAITWEHISPELFVITIQVKMISTNSYLYHYIHLYI